MRLEQIPVASIKEGDRVGMLDPNLLKSVENRQQLYMPILVRQNCTGYNLLAGYRRKRVAEVMGDELIWAVIREADEEAAVEDRYISLSSNATRSPNPMHEAWDIMFLLAEGETQEQIGKGIGRTQGYISQRKSLVTKLIPEFQRQLEDGSLVFDSARNLIRLSPEMQRELLEKYGTPSFAVIKQTIKAKNSRQVNVASLPPMPAPEGGPVPPPRGCFIDGETMASVSPDRPATIQWGGKTYLIREVTDD